MTRNTEYPLERLLNLKLEDVVANKELGDLRLATDAEIQTLSGDVADSWTKGTLLRWHVIAIEKRSHFAKAAVLGYLEETRLALRTSEIVALDLDRRLVQTLNSVYRLEDRAEGEVPTDLVWFLCATFDPTTQRLLGMPEAFF